MKRTDDFYINILDGEANNQIINLGAYNKEHIVFGRDAYNDIVLQSSIVSRYHGYFRFEGDTWVIYDNNSMNGLRLNNNTQVSHKRLLSGDKILIGYEETEKAKKVVFLFSNKSPQNVYRQFSLAGRQKVTIGRDSTCDIDLPYVAVLKKHCHIVVERPDECYLELAVPNAQVQYNGTKLQKRQRLSEMDCFLIGDTQFVYKNNALHYTRSAEGLSFEVSHLSKIVSSGNKQKCINTDVSFSVNAGEFVAIIGGSGAGKSTLLNCLCGCSKISVGTVTIAGEDLNSGYDSLKHLIGYVPQQDIVYDNLTLEKMLYYTARLRMPDDSTREEIELRIQMALQMVELTDKRELLIKKLSGGQKKRASIAVELLSDPKLFFLDEPTSGLDPGTESNLMMTLKEMTKKGKTVVLVTHTPLNLHLCDKVVIMGTGGRLCFYGEPMAAMQFFGVSNFVGIYEKINSDAAGWQNYYNSVRNHMGENHIPPSRTEKKRKDTSRKSSLRQTGILIRRYVSLQYNDLRRVLIQILMAPGLGILLYAAFKDSYPFLASYDTQKIALTLACCAFWVGLFNSIQEICKESQIYRRERMANLKLLPYVGSKVVVNAAMDLLQTILLLLMVGGLLGMPEQGMQFSDAPVMEIFLTTYLTMLSATCIGLLVSALVANSDQAISVAPVLLIPQILFSGIIVDLQGMVETISYFVSCRYACVAYCTTADINNLPSGFKLTGLGVEEQETVIIDSMYSYSGNINSTVSDLFGESFAQEFANPIAGGWFMLMIMSVIVVGVTILILKQKSKIK